MEGNAGASSDLRLRLRTILFETVAAFNCGILSVFHNIGYEGGSMLKLPELWVKSR